MMRLDAAKLRIVLQQTGEHPFGDYLQHRLVADVTLAPYPVADALSQGLAQPVGQ